MTMSQKLYVRMVRETSGLPEGFDGDYKDAAAVRSRATWNWWLLLEASMGSEIPEDFRKDMEAMPSGFSCPRSYGDWEIMMCERYGQNAADPTPAGR